MSFQNGVGTTDSAVAQAACRIRVAACWPAVARWLLLLVTLGLAPGCAIVPRSQMDECQQVAKTLRSENARLKDRCSRSKARTVILPTGRSTIRAG